MIYDVAGINMSPVKKALVAGRLNKRVKHFGLASYGEYFKYLTRDVDGEFQVAVDMLTTNETFFFREQKHFDFLRQRVLAQRRGGSLRLWSAASSSGEEAYSLAMEVSEHAPTSAWEIVGTDISTRVLAVARSGQYPIARAEDIPERYLKKYCLKGIGAHEGTFIVDPKLKARVSFVHANLKENLSKLGMFDVVFLRNVMIYFDLVTKRQVVAGIIRQLKPGGFLMVGHSESLNGITEAIRLVAPSIYQNPV